MNKKLLQYLIDHPTWHYGLDLVKAGQGNRGTIYISLGRLEEDGYIEQRLEPEPSVPALQLRRTQYRATGKRVPEPDMGGVPA